MPDCHFFSIVSLERFPPSLFRKMYRLLKNNNNNNNKTLSPCSLSVGSFLGQEHHRIKKKYSWPNLFCQISLLWSSPLQLCPTPKSKPWVSRYECLLSCSCYLFGTCYSATVPDSTYLVTLLNLFESCKPLASIFFFSILFPLSKFYLYDSKSQAVVISVSKVGWGTDRCGSWGEVVWWLSG